LSAFALDDLVAQLPRFRSLNKQWDHVFHIQPTTAFAPTEIHDDDWLVLIRLLANA
jgi:hypothetical protein